jgi:hypothetical protein
LPVAIEGENVTGALKFRETTTPDVRYGRENLDLDESRGWIGDVIDAKDVVDGETTCSGITILN